MNRRGLLAGAGVGAASLVGGGVLLSGQERSREAAAAPRSPSAVVPFFGDHQAGVATPQQGHVILSAFDATATSAEGLRDLLRAWSGIAATLCGPGPSSRATSGSEDSLTEALGLPCARLTVTFGLGPGLFEGEKGERFALARQRPPALLRIREFRGDALDPARGDGDLCVQVCSDDPQVAFYATHALARAAVGAAVPRWSQPGFLRAAPGETPRNLLGFKDGTRNIATDDAATMVRHVWADRRDGSGWMHGGTYMAVRRIGFLLDVWDAAGTAEQERVIGRHKASGAPLGAQRERDPLPLDDGGPIPADAHVRVASREANDGVQILRRGYAYHEGIDPETVQMDAGLLFISFQRDPAQFVRLQERLAGRDALFKHIQHRASAVFACPPGARQGGYVGEGLFVA